MWLQRTIRTHYQILFISYPKISSKVRLMRTITMWQLSVEHDQSRGRPTSWSLLKLPDSSLYLQLLSRGRIFPSCFVWDLWSDRWEILREGRVSLSNSKIYSLFSIFLFLWITLNRILKRRKLPPIFLHATCHFLDFFSLFLFVFRFLYFSIILHLSLILFSLCSFISPNFT